jgi:hypothetical protein
MTRWAVLALTAVLNVVLWFAMTPAGAVLAQGSTPEQVGVAGSDRSLWAHRSGQIGFTFLGGTLLAAPAVVSVPVGGSSPGSPIYIATGTDNALYVRSLSIGWRRLSTGFTYCIDNPAGVVANLFAGNLLTVACQGRDHALWLGQAPITAGSLPVIGNFHSAGGVLVTGPAVAWMTGFGQPMLFANGTDGHVWIRALGNPPMDWSPMTTVSGGRLSCLGHPAAAAVWVPNSGPRGGTMPALFACHGTDGRVWLSEWNRLGQGWSDAFTIGGQAVNGVAVAVNPDSATVYVQGTDSAIWHNTVLNNPPHSSSGWSTLGGTAIGGTGAAALLLAANTPP